ncbi:MAG: hypothetical protein L6R42_003011 [Xanthoria sp. 1 TBL-2021]|nr:MAG: hypothetical protein L6R42_003011 [Xanthoria sp. 1 TBL-2021]
MTRRDILNFFHEPFGDAFYFGPEKISPAHLRWSIDKIESSGRGHYTYDWVLQSILTADEDPTKRVFIKDMSYHIIPPIHSITARAPSLQAQNLSSISPNPTLLPTQVVDAFKFVFLVRNPASAIPSLYRCFIPPLSTQTEDTSLDPTELGYRELRILFDYLRDKNKNPLPLLIDADDLLADPDAILHPLCAYLEIPYSPSMLSWPTAEDHAFAFSLFEKYAGYHQDALNSTALALKAEKKDTAPRSSEERNDEWKAKYGKEAMQVIRSAVDACRDDYEYLRSFRMRPS